MKIDTLAVRSFNSTFLPNKTLSATLKSKKYDCPYSTTVLHNLDEVYDVGRCVLAVGSSYGDITGRLNSNSTNFHNTLTWLKRGAGV